LPYDNSWGDLTITVIAKFTLIDFDLLNPPSLYVTQPITSGNFYAYGSVSAISSDSKYYLSECSTTIQISQYQVPIISDITFNQQSFKDRVAKVSTK
jgi:hypothetical protein